eukprot:6200316-Pleurochrysis_carterae.AAC.7
MHRAEHELQPICATPYAVSAVLVTVHAGPFSAYCWHMQLALERVPDIDRAHGALYVLRNVHRMCYIVFYDRYCAGVLCIFVYMISLAGYSSTI